MDYPNSAGKAADVQMERRVCANKSNSRGRRTFEWRPWEDGEGKQKKGVRFDNPQVTYYYREPGEVCGAHCHRGNNPHDPDRNPEEILFLLGDVEIEFEDLWGDTRTLSIDVRPGEPVSVRIPPWVLHTFRVGSRGLHFMEAKRNPYSRNAAEQDVCSVEEFRSMQDLRKT